jgi:hypothetical protein
MSDDHLAIRSLLQSFIAEDDKWDNDDCVPILTAIRDRIDADLKNIEEVKNGGPIYRIGYKPAKFDKQKKFGLDSIKDSDIQWIVNTSAELGVRIGGQNFYLWKGDSLWDSQLKYGWRPVEKREFGETCRPWTSKEFQASIERHPLGQFGTVSDECKKDWAEKFDWNFEILPKKA